MDTFPRCKICSQPRVQFRKNLLWIRTLKKRKKLLRSKNNNNNNNKRWKKKNKKGERRCEIAAKNKELKKIKKAEKDKRYEKEIRARLKELNSNFAKMEEQKKLDNKKKKLYFL